MQYFRFSCNATLIFDTDSSLRRIRKPLMSMIRGLSILAMVALAARLIVNPAPVSFACHATPLRTAALAAPPHALRVRATEATPEPAGAYRAPAYAAPPPRTEPAVQIEQASFGVFSLTADGGSTSSPRRRVPLKPNQEFGWVIGVTTTKPTVRWREEFTVPYPPETWGPVEGKHEISADRKVSILKREVTPIGDSCSTRGPSRRVIRRAATSSR